MFQLLKIEEIKHLDVDGSILWEEKDIGNIFHVGGEIYLLNVAFNSSGGITIPVNYYLGVDNRPALAASDTLASLVGEPTQFGYIRQPVSSTNGFTVQDAGGGNYRANSQVVTFSATGGTWGPVINIFLATTINNSGYLISSAKLSQSRSVQDGQSMTLKISVGLKNC